MRLILHNLGKFLSHRDVKVGLFRIFIVPLLGYFACLLTITHATQELVQSALIESNTGRDDRILYKKLVDMNL